MFRVLVFLNVFLLLACGNSGSFSDGKRIPQFEETDFITKEKITNNSLKGKYTLIDFWGSWCGHCIDGIPELVDIHNIYGDRLNILSIATDKPQDKEKLKRLIADNGMKWKHIWSNYNLPSDQLLFKKFEIDVFPTVILLDTNANEIARLRASFFFENRVKDLLKKLNLQKISP